MNLLNLETHTTLTDFPLVVVIKSRINQMAKSINSPTFSRFAVSLYLHIKKIIVVKKTLT